MRAERRDYAADCLAGGVVGLLTLRGPGRASLAKVERPNDDGGCLSMPGGVQR